eukprot:1978-Heterococcus_DN1.PRE.2
MRYDAVVAVSIHVISVDLCKLSKNAAAVYTMYTICLQQHQLQWCSTAIVVLVLVVTAHQMLFRLSSCFY